MDDGVDTSLASEGTDLLVACGTQNNIVVSCFTL